MTTNDKPLTRNSDSDKEALDEIPTETCESSEIATWKGLKFESNGEH